jgi:hypothetical protein
MQKNQKACPANEGYRKEETCPFLPDLVIQVGGQAGVPGHKVMQESGLSQSMFCSRENLSVKTFSYWK